MNKKSVCGVRPALYLGAGVYVEDTTTTAPVANVIYTDAPTILRVQQALNEAGFNCGTPDGDAGAMTKSAVKAYREKNGLKVSEEIDTELLMALGIQP